MKINIKFTDGNERMINNVVRVNTVENSDFIEIITINNDFQLHSFDSQELNLIYIEDYIITAI